MSEIKDLEAEIAQASQSRDLERFNALMQRHAKLTAAASGTAAVQDMPRPRAPGSRKPGRAPRAATRTVASDQLPVIWGEGSRALPNPMVRSGLFSVRRNGPRMFLDTVPIAAIGDTLLLYKGEELRVRDEDVLMQVYHFQREFALGVPWQVRGMDFLSALRWGTGAVAYSELLTSLRRLRAGTLTVARKTNAEGGVSVRDRSFFQGLDIARANRGSAWEISITVEPMTRLLWEHYGYTLVNWSQRIELESPLSRWLHRFLSSHQSPYPYRVETYHQLCGSPTASLAKFRQQIKASLQDLCDIGFLSSFWLDERDLVNVRRALAAA